ncbi:hypothetical protein M758_6G167500 [Ceratodon purpureus]|uniref:Uncharacterized protein n=1 Tax=Ceratodon purpureus TaxID=3225 RepID=A0A8T0HI15_CERPU|nr:hypothetical protein KC19_6G173900 [Ceratodon purpureus]KAG0570597.1 hypothetical protein KC19_6G173900 [Ceratodon purpureus]KAG0614313.1 hypothetical protein M758_6G167500 [Ceratodon purpureus]
MAGFSKAWPATLLLLGLLLSAGIDIDPVNCEIAPPQSLLSKMKCSIGFGTGRILQLLIVSPPKNLPSDEEMTGSNKDVEIGEKEGPSETSKFQSRHLLGKRGRPTPSRRNPPPPIPRAIRPPTPPSP